MADETTTNYGWEKPDVAADDDTWGDILNAVIDAVDTDLKAVSDVADAGGFRTLSYGTVTNQATCDITIPSGYHSFLLKLYGVSPNVPASGYLWLRLNGGAGFITNSYQYVATNYTAGATAPTYSSNVTTAAIPLSGSGGLNTYPAGSGHFDVTMSFPTSGESGFYPSIVSKGIFQSLGGGGLGFQSADVTGYNNIPSVRPTQVRIMTDSGNISLGYVLMAVPNS